MKFEEKLQKEKPQKQIKKILRRTQMSPLRSAYLNGNSISTKCLHICMYIQIHFQWCCCVKSSLPVYILYFEILSFASVFKSHSRRTCKFFCCIFSGYDFNFIWVYFACTDSPVDAQNESMRESSNERLVRFCIYTPSHALDTLQNNTC